MCGLDKAAPGALGVHVWGDGGGSVSVQVGPSERPHWLGFSRGRRLPCVSVEWGGGGGFVVRESGTVLLCSQVLLPPPGTLPKGEWHGSETTARKQSVVCQQDKKKLKDGQFFVENIDFLQQSLWI